MTQEHQAADALRKFARLLEPVSEAVEVLDRLGSYKQAEAEAQAAAQEAGSRRDAVKQELNDLQTQHADLVSQHKQAIEKVQEHANRIIAEAEASASHLVETALRDADAIKAKASSAAAEMRADGMRERDSMIVAANMAKKDRDAALLEVAKAQAQLGELQTRISAERSRISALIDSLKQ